MLFGTDPERTSSLHEATGPGGPTTSRGVRGVRWVQVFNRRMVFWGIAALCLKQMLHWDESRLFAPFGR